VPLCKRGRLGLPPGGPSGRENAQNASAAGNDVSAANNAPEIRNASTEKSGGLINNHASPFVANTMSIHWRPPPAFHNTIFLFRRTGPERGPQSAKLERELKEGGNKYKTKRVIVFWYITHPVARHSGRANSSSRISLSDNHKILQKW
jgi:hypothetical protein